MNSIPFNLGVLGTPNGFQCASLFPEKIGKRIIEHLDLILLNKLLPNPKDQSEFPIYALTSFTENNKVYFGISQYTSCYQVSGNRSGNFFGSFFISDQIPVPEDLNRIFLCINRISKALKETGVVVGDRYAKEIDELELDFIPTNWYNNLKFSGISYPSAIQASLDKKLLVILEETKSFEDVSRSLTEITLALHESHVLNLFSNIILTADPQVIKEIVADESNYLVIKQSNLIAATIKESGNRSLFRFVLETEQLFQERRFKGTIEKQKRKLVEIDAKHKEELGQKDKAMQEFQVKFSDLETRAGNLVKELEVTREQVKSIQKNLEREKRDKDNLIRTYKIESERKLKEITKLQEVSFVDKKDKRELEKQLKACIEESESIKKKNTQYQREFERVKEHIKNQDQQIARFNTEKLTYEKNIKELNVSVQHKTQQYNALNDQYRQINNLYTEAKKNYQVFLNEQETELKKQFNVALEEQKAKSNKRENDLKVGYERKIKENEVFHNQAIRLKISEVAKYQADIKKLQSQIADLNQQIINIRKEGQNIQNKLEYKNSVEKQLRHEIDARKTDYEKIIIEKNKLIGERKLLEDRLRDENYKANDYATKLDVSNRNLEQTRRKISDYISKIEYLERELNLKESELKAKNNELNQVRISSEPSIAPTNFVKNSGSIAGLDFVPTASYPDKAYLDSKLKDYSNFKLQLNNLDWKSLHKVRHSLDKLHNCLFGNFVSSVQVQESLFGDWTSYDKLPNVLNHLERYFLILEGLTADEYLHVFKGDKKLRFDYFKNVLYALYTNFSAYIKCTELSIFAQKDTLNLKKIEQAISVSSRGQNIKELCNLLTDTGIENYITSGDMESIRKVRAQLIEQLGAEYQQDGAAFIVYRAFCALYLLRFIYKVFNLN